MSANIVQANLIILLKLHITNTLATVPKVPTPDAKTDFTQNLTS